MRLWDVASSLNARYVRVFSFLRNQAAPAPSEESRDWLEWLRAVARDRDVTVGVENEHSCAVGTFPELHDMASRLSPLFPLVLDPCNHWQLSNDDGRVDLKGRRSLIEHAIDVHVKDVDADGAYTTIGDGVIAWDDILGVLEDRSYTGLVTLEPHLRGDRTRLRKSVEVVRAWLG